MAQRENIDFYAQSMLLYQFMIHSFRYPNDDFTFMWKTRDKIQDKACEDLKLQYEYIPIEKRNQKYIVLLTDQILGTNHAPSRIIYEFAYVLQQKLGIEVCIVVMVPSAEEHISKELGINYTINYEKRLQGCQRITYRECIFTVYESVLSKENENDIRQIWNEIYRNKPLFVWDFSPEAYFTKIIKKFTTCVYKQFTKGYAAVEADIIVNSIRTDNEQDCEHAEFLKKLGVDILETHISLPYVPTNKPIERGVYGIAEEAFVIGIVGNRLDAECDDVFLAVLQSCAQKIPNLTIVFYGIIPEEKMESIKKALGEYCQVIFMGYCIDLMYVLQLIDVLVNPPRLGGGSVAGMVLTLGKPVVTTNFGDVAYIAGEEFCVETEENYADVLREYAVNAEYYEQQSIKSQERIMLVTTDENQLADIFKQLMARVLKKERDYADNYYDINDGEAEDYHGR